MGPQAFEALMRYVREAYGEVSPQMTTLEQAAMSSGGMWLEWNDVQDVARKLSIKTVPVLSEVMYATSWTEIVRGGIASRVAFDESMRPAAGYVAEGIVVRSNPTLFNRRGQRAMWKLKTSDF